MDARASAKYLRGSPQKARLVVDMIRGKNVNQALAILRYSNKRAALGIEKCVKSAIANANEAAEKANISVDPDELWLKAAYVDDGPTKNRRRLRPAPQGRAFRQQRHFCHVTILLSSDEPGENGKKEAAGPTVSKKAKRGGAAAAPRQKGGKKAETTKAAPEVSEAPAKKAASKKSGAKKAASKAASKLGSALKRKKKTEKDEK
ncbi:MAG TPA: 50S ribosomal protein L22 [Pyrinomonadaceae bacterium]|jgi:large subunit ribosomal protein L22|nr:50S ribosomal protein L22 [Pyrinomonadaceae bacterium]